MSTPEAVAWKWGFVADMTNQGGVWEILNWRHPTIGEPNKGQLTAAQAQYDARNKRAERVENAVKGGDKEFLVLQIHFDQENRIRALEGQPALSLGQYKAVLESRL